MSAGGIMERFADTAPRFTTRIAGAFYLINIVAGVFAVLVHSALIVRGDAAATATKILASEPLFRLSFAAELLAIGAYVAVVPIFYRLFSPVSRSLSLIAAVLGFVGDAVIAITTLSLLAPLLLLGGAQYVAMFEIEQLQSLMLMVLRLNAQGDNISLLFFGVYCLLISYLICKSSFLPRFLGVPMAFAGFGWLAGSCAKCLSPLFAMHLYPYILAGAVVGESSLCLWLLFIGVNTQQLKEETHASDYTNISAQPSYADSSPLAQDHSLDAFNKDAYGHLKGIILRSAEKMPEENYNFKPTEAVRSFGQILGHVADAQYSICSIALGEKNPSLKIEKTKTSKADLIAALKDAFAYCDKAHESMTDAAATQAAKFMGADMRKVDILTVNNMHTIEHYGNLVTYLRLKNIVPPTSEPGFLPPPSK